jgi:hypothetical protein
MPSYNSPHHAQHQAAYRERRKAGLKPVAAPWHWLSLSDVQRLAAEAYRVATFDCREVSDPCCTPENFAADLQQVFEVFIADAAAAAGYQVAPAGAAGYAAQTRAYVPASWSPRYPVYATPEKEPAA